MFINMDKFNCAEQTLLCNTPEKYNRILRGSLQELYLKDNRGGIIRFPYDHLFKAVSEFGSIYFREHDLLTKDEIIFLNDVIIDLDDIGLVERLYKGDADESLRFVSISLLMDTGAEIILRLPKNNFPSFKNMEVMKSYKPIELGLEVGQED